jgi:hypothetical protein
MKSFPNPQDITPRDFEIAVKKWFEASAHAKSLDTFEVKHLDAMKGVDGEYEFDVTIRFSMFVGMKVSICCECKKHKNAIKREVVQVLHSKVQSVGAHKGCIVSTAPFQKGALEYAKQHGIALLQLVGGNLAYIQMNARREIPLIPDDADDYVALFECDSVDGIPLTAIASSEKTYWLEELIKIPTSKHSIASTVD